MNAVQYYREMLKVWSHSPGNASKTGSKLWSHSNVPLFLKRTGTLTDRKREVEIGEGENFRIANATDICQSRKPSQQVNNNLQIFSLQCRIKSFIIKPLKAFLYLRHLIPICN